MNPDQPRIYIRYVPQHQQLVDLLLPLLRGRYRKLSFRTEQVDGYPEDDEPDGFREEDAACIHVSRNWAMVVTLHNDVEALEPIRLRNLVNIVDCIASAVGGMVQADTWYKATFHEYPQENA